jgi:type II secretory pathway predicted ATPase ExeA
MRSPQLRQLAQRVGADYHIGQLTEEETSRYIRHRLKVAGGSQDIFSEDAIRLVHASGRGIPRLINQLCDTALVYAFSEQRKDVDAKLMQETIRDRCEGGIFPGKLVKLEPQPDRRSTDATGTGQ